MKTRAAISVLALSTVLAMAQPALAQEAGRPFGVEASVRIGHDTNVSKSSKEAARQAGIDPSDTVISPTLTLNITRPLSRQAFYLIGRVGADYYSKNDFYNTARSDLHGGFNLHGGPCDGSLDQGFGRSRAAAQALALVATRNIEKTELTNLTGVCGRSIGFAPTFGVGHSSGKNSETLLSGSDFDSWNYSLGLAYRRPGFGEVRFFGTHSTTKNQNRTVTIGGVTREDGFSLSSAGVRYTRRFGARLEGDAEVTYTKVDPEFAVTESFSGMTYAAHIDFRPQSRIDSHLSLVRSVTPSQQLGASYSVSTTELFGATYQLGGRLSVDGSITHADNQYHGATQIVGLTVTDDVMSTLALGARYSLGRRIFLTADTRWEKRNTDIVGLDYSSNLTAVGVAAKF